MTIEPIEIFFSILGEFLNPGINSKYISVDNFIGITNFGLIVVLILFGLAINNHLDINIPKHYIIIIMGSSGIITTLLSPPGLMVIIFTCYAVVFKIVSGSIVGQLVVSSPIALIAFALAVIAFLLLSIFSSIISEDIHLAINIFLIIYSIISVFRLVIIVNAPGILGNIFFLFALVLIICIGTFAPTSFIEKNPEYQSIIKTILDMLFLKYSYLLGLIVGALIELSRKK